MFAKLLLVFTLALGPLFATDRTALREEILRVERDFNQYCMDHGRAAGWMEFIADHAYLMNRQTVGRAEARASFVGEPTDSSLTWTPSYADVATSGELGYSWGVWISKGAGPDGKPAERRGIYLTIWRKQADGRWKFVFDGGRPLADDAIARIHQSLKDHPAADYSFPAPTPTDAATLKRQLIEFDLAFSNEAVTQGQRGAFLSRLADEALLLDRGVRTRAAAADSMAKEGDSKSTSWSPFLVDVSAAGDLAYVCGEWVAQAIAPDGKPAETTGVYSAIWKRQADSSWKMVFDNGRAFPRASIDRIKARLAEVAEKNNTP